MSIRSLPRNRGFLTTFGASGALLLLLASAAGATEPQPPAPAEEEPAAQAGEKPAAQAGEEPAAQAGEEPAAQAGEEPAVEAGQPAQSAAGAAQEEEREWLVDDQGKEYYVRKVSKASFGIFRRVDEDTIRGRYGRPLKLAGEDEEYFYQKIFHVKKVEIPTGPSAEELARLAAAYEVEIETGDALELVPFDEGLPRQGLWRHGFDVGDMNGDGHLDIVHAPPRKSLGVPPPIWLGDSRGHWRRWEEVSFPAAPYDYGDAAVDDLNGDGKQDIVLGMHVRGVLALVGDGEGGFELWTEGIELEQLGHQGKPAFTSRQVETVDWNGDGRPDIVAIAEGPRGFSHVQLAGGNGIVVYLNQGDGTWTKLAEEKPLIIGNHLRIADMNGDSRPDIVTSSGSYGYHWLVNLHQEDDTWTPTSVDALRPRLWVWSVEVADMNGDSRPDLAYGYYTNELGVNRAGLDMLYGREDGGWERRTLLNTVEKESRVDVRALAAGDLDADGALDLVGLTDGGQVLIYRGDGEGGLIREDEPFVGTGEEPDDRSSCQGYTVILKDLDGDGRDEILADFSGESCRLGFGGSIRVWRVKSRP